MQAKKQNTRSDIKPRYNMWQCSGYMIALAWRDKEKKVPLLCVLSAFLSVAANLIGLYITPSILSAVERQVSYKELIFTVLLFVALSIITSAASSYIGTNAMYGRVSVRTALIKLINKKACTTSYINSDKEKYTELLARSARVTSGNSESTEAIWGTLTALLVNTAGLAVYITIIIHAGLVLVPVILAAALAGYFINLKIGGYGYRHRDEEAKISNILWYNNSQGKNYNLAKDLRLFGMRDWIDEIFKKTMLAYQAFHKRAQNVYIWGRIADIILAFIRNGAAYAYLIYLVLNNSISASEFLLYFSAVGGFTGWINGLLGGFTAMHRQSLDISSVREFLEFPETFLFEEGEQVEKDTGAGYEIRLDNVSFRYPGAEQDTLKNINLILHPGEKLAVVGLNGAGKTTLVKILCGLFDPTEGRVLLNGKDVRGFNRRSYYELFSAVFQDFSLLAGSIAANVAQTDDTIDMERVKDCIRKADLAAKIESLPNGYETLLNRSVYDDATELSGGETQRLMLARALYKDAPVILLDEPTAALDPIAEADLYHKYRAMTDGKSSVYISHRLASTRFCDRIVLIAENRIAEEGTHEELLKRGGKYAKLFAVQSKYYREGKLDEE